MSDNKRVSQRVGIVIQIKMICDNGTEYLLNSRNISDNGVFLEREEHDINVTLGTQVVLQVCSQLSGGDPPPVNAKIMRITDEGLGLHFLL